MTKRKIVILAGIGVPLLIGFLFMALFCSMVRVPTGSMRNAIQPGDRLVVSKLAQEIKRGDIVMFKYPEDPNIRYVSRVIGLPGETIEIRKNKVFINDNELAERRVMIDSDIDYENPSKPFKELSVEGEGNYTVYCFAEDETEEDLFPGTQAPFGVREPYRIPNGEYFCMGDNRDDSHDSRYWGTVKTELIVGKPLFIYWSEEKDSLGNSKTRWSRVFTKLK